MDELHACRIRFPYQCIIVVRKWITAIIYAIQSSLTFCCLIYNEGLCPIQKVDQKWQQVVVSDDVEKPKNFLKA